jgi:hypothetical protein
VRGGFRPADEPGQLKDVSEANGDTVTQYVMGDRGSIPGMAIGRLYKMGTRVRQAGWLCCSRLVARSVLRPVPVLCAVPCRENCRSLHIVVLFCCFDFPSCDIFH